MANSSLYLRNELIAISTFVFLSLTLFAYREIDDLNQLIENLKKEHEIANITMLQSIKTSHTRIGELEAMLHHESPEKGIKSKTRRDMEVARG